MRIIYMTFSLIASIASLLPVALGHQTPSYNGRLTSIGFVPSVRDGCYRHQYQQLGSRLITLPAATNRLSHSLSYLRASSPSNNNIHQFSFQNNLSRGSKDLLCSKTMFARLAAAVISKINKMIGKIISQFTRIVTIVLLSLGLLVSLPSNSWANGNNMRSLSSTSTSLESPRSFSSSSYYLQNNPQYNPQQQARENGVTSIQTQRSRPRSSRVPNQRSNSINSQTYRFIKTRNNNPRYKKGKKKQTVKRISLAVLGTTIAASSYRASLRKSRIVRNASPFGIIRNVSPLGNGVSVIRVCMALKFDNDDDDNASTSKNGTDRRTVVEGDGDGADSLLKRLHLEEKELYTKMAMLSQIQLSKSDAYNLKQKSLGEYLSNVASIFFQSYKYMQYGSIDSIRVPFVEEAARAFRQGAKEERIAYKKQRILLQNNKQSTHPSSTNKKGYILATILLAIKGDRTSVTLPFGIIRQRDVARALSRIAKDATVENCLVASEVMTIPGVQSSSNIGEGVDASQNCSLLSEEDILKVFPDMVQLT